MTLPATDSTILAILRSNPHTRLFKALYARLTSEKAKIMALHIKAKTLFAAVEPKARGGR